MADRWHHLHQPFKDAIQAVFPDLTEGLAEDLASSLAIDAEEWVEQEQPGILTKEPSDENGMG